MALPKMKMRPGRAKGVSRLLIWLSVAALFAAGCESKKNATAKASPPSLESETEGRVILKIGETEYFSSDFKKYIRNAFGEKADTLEAATLSRLLDEFFETKLLFHAAQQKGVVVSEEEKNAYLEKLKQGGAGEETTELWEFESGDLMEKLVIEKYLAQVTQDVTVDDEEVRRYYELHKSEFFLPERVQVSQILLPTEAEAVETWENLRSASEEEFRVAARTKSIGPEAAHGGEMGVFQKGQLPQEMEAAVFSLAEGEVSSVIESSYGFHIFRLDKKFESEWLSLAEASASISRLLLDLKIKQAIRLHLQSLEGSLKWQLFPENLFFPYQRNTS